LSRTYIIEQFIFCFFNYFIKVYIYIYTYLQAQTSHNIKTFASERKFKHNLSRWAVLKHWIVRWDLSVSQPLKEFLFQLVRIRLECSRATPHFRQAVKVSPHCFTPSQAWPEGAPPLARRTHVGMVNNERSPICMQFFL
jgi:hypothetical protein